MPIVRFDSLWSRSAGWRWLTCSAGLLWALVFLGAPWQHSPAHRASTVAQFDAKTVAPPSPVPSSGANAALTAAPAAPAMPAAMPTLAIDSFDTAHGMSPPGRPNGESPSAPREGSPVSAVDSAPPPPPTTSPRGVGVVWDQRGGAVSGAGLIAAFCCAGAYSTTYANRSVSRGKHYWELTLSVRPGQEHPDSWTDAGVADDDAAKSTRDSRPLAKQGVFDGVLGRGKRAQFRNGDVFMFALDANAALLHWGVNGQWFNGNPGDGSGGISVGKSGSALVPFVNVTSSSQQQSPEGDRWIANFGDRAFRFGVPIGYAAYGATTVAAPIPVASAPVSATARSTANDSLMGKVLRGQAVVGGQAVPLPAGDWVGLAFFRGGAGANQGDLAVLGRLEGNRLAAMVAINGQSFGTNRSSKLPPFASCERADYVVRTRIANEPGGEQRCWWINHATGIWQDQGPFRAARQELALRDVTPSQVLLNVGFRRANQDGFVTAFYYFDPSTAGITSSPLIWSASEWHKDRVHSDPARTKYIQDLQRWAEGWAPLFFASR